MEDWGEEIFAKGVGVILSAPPPTRHCTNPLPVKHLITIQDGGIENLIYLAFPAKMRPALQAKHQPAAVFWTLILPLHVKAMLNDLSK